MAEKTSLTVFNDGPIKVEGEFVLRDPQGNAFDLTGRAGVALCRCGHSQNKPFCDGSHKTSGFESRVEAR